MTMAALRFGTASAAPGWKTFGRLNIDEGGKKATIPVCVIHGARTGRHVVVLANQHGTELNGIESVRRFCEAADPRRISGTIFAVISANPRAAAAGQPVWTEDAPKAEITYNGPYNMNFVWPGRRNGKVVERAVHEIWTQAILAPHRRADFVLDLHAHQNPTAVYADDERIADLGVVAGIRHIVLTGLSEEVATLSLACHRAGIPCMTAELGQQGTFCAESIAAGLVAIENLLKFQGLLPGRLRLPEEAIILDPWRDHRLTGRTFKSPSYVDVMARHDGLVVQHRQVYDLVRKGEPLGHVIDPFSGKVVEEILSPMTGAIYNWRTKGVVCAKGQRLVTLARTTKVKPAEYVERLPGMKRRLDGAIQQDIRRRQGD